VKRALPFAPAAAWALVILGLGSLPALRVPTTLPLDKVAHFGMFAVLGTLIAFGLHRAHIAASLAWPLLAGTLVGALDELHQRTVPGRSAEWADLVADVAGCAVALFLAHMALERRAARAPDADPDDRAGLANHTQEHRA
jgi:VanZ family protein